MNEQLMYIVVVGYLLANWALIRLCQMAPQNEDFDD